MRHVYLYYLYIYYTILYYIILFIHLFWFSCNSFLMFLHNGLLLGFHFIKGNQACEGKRMKNWKWFILHAGLWLKLSTQEDWLHVVHSGGIFKLLSRIHIEEQRGGINADLGQAQLTSIWQVKSAPYVNL